MVNGLFHILLAPLLELVIAIMSAGDIPFSSAIYYLRWQKNIDIFPNTKVIKISDCFKKDVMGFLPSRLKMGELPKVVGDTTFLIFWTKIF